MAKKTSGTVKISPAGYALLAGILGGGGGQAAAPPAKGKPSPTVTAHPAAATAPPTAPAPGQPAPVSPFLTAEDFGAISAFYTDLNTKLSTITGAVGTFDPTTGTWSGGQEQADTTYQTTQNDKAATANNGAAQDDAAARGIFQSSIKDATLYDIEAQRSLSDKFLTDKLTTDRLYAGTQMQILANSKSDFDKNYGSVDANGSPIWGRVAFQNAQGINDTNNSAWASAMAAWQAANPDATPPTAPPATTATATATKPPAKGVPSSSVKVGTTPAATLSRGVSVAQSAAQAFAKNQSKKKYYG